MRNNEKWSQKYLSDLQAGLGGHHGATGSLASTQRYGIWETEMYLAETIGRTALAEGEPGQNTRAKTKLTENIIRSLITESKQHLDPWMGRTGDTHMCRDVRYASVQSSVAFTINFKSLSALPDPFICVRLSDLERTLGNYIPNSNFISFTYLKVETFSFCLFVFRLRNIKHGCKKACFLR